MRVLCVSIACPPKNDPESLQTGKYLKYLSQENKFDIVTSAHPTLWMNHDEHLNHYLSNIEQLIEVTIKEPKYWSIVGNKFFRKWFRPDTRSSFHKQSASVIADIKHQPDIIYSRSYPLSSTILAEKLVDTFQVPWILHLSDPWTESPLFNYDKSSYHLKTEKRCFQKASKICFTSEKTISIYSKKYPELSHKFEHFPNVYDPSDVLPQNNVETSKKKFTLLYTGSLIGSRSLQLLLEAIEVLEEEQKNKIEVLVAGGLDARNKKQLQNHANIAQHLGFVPYQDLKDVYAKANALVAVDFDFKNPKDGIYFPSKLLDYFAAQKPILAITSPNSTTDQVLKNMPHKVVYHGQTKEMVQHLTELITTEPSKKVPLPEKFSAEFNAKKLTELMRQLCPK